VHRCGNQLALSLLRKGSALIPRIIRTWAVRRRGGVFVEYLLLITLVGIGVIAGLAAVRSALVNELNDLADAINAIAS
jgi:Flp pilus assembly pilin Flp